MHLDAQQLFSDAQALTATAVSTNIIDFGSDRNIGQGEPLAAVINVDVALAGTSPTFQVEVEADDNAAFSSAADVILSKSFTALAAGARVVVPIPSDLLPERFIRLNYVLGGTTPTITVTSHLEPMRMIQSAGAAAGEFADGFTIS